MVLNKNNILGRVSIVIYILSYVLFSAIIGERNTSIESVCKIFLLLIMLYFIFKEKTNILLQNETLFLRLSIILFVLQLLFFQNIRILQWIVNVFVFYFLSKYSKKDYLVYFTWAMRIAGVALAASAIQLAIEYGAMFFFRSETFMDKQYYTCFLGISSIICLVDIIYKKNTVLNTILLIIYLAVNILIIQSKLSLFSFGVIAVLFFLLQDTDTKKRFWIIVKWLFLTSCVVAYFFPNLVIPDPIKYGINTLLGENVFYIETNVSRLDSTYDTRSRLWLYCTTLFLEYPLIGIGIGNFANFNKGTATIGQLEETESSLLSIICEGGIFYCILMFFFFSFIFKRAWRLVIYNKSYIGNICLCIIATYIILIIGNDFMDSLFWISLGIISGVMNSEKECMRKKIRT